MNLTHQSLAHARHFAREHDSFIAFHAGFLLLTILAASMLNLGFFGLLIVIHMVLDIVKYHEFNGFNWRTTLAATFHESLIDIALFFVALVFSVYFHHTVGIVGVSGLLHAEMAFIRFMGTSIPKFFILEDFLKVVAHIHHYMERVRPDLYKEWRPIDQLYVFSIFLSVSLLLLAPQITNTDSGIIQWIVVWELTPWNL